MSKKDIVFHERPKAVKYEYSEGVGGSINGPVWAIEGTCPACNHPKSSHKEIALKDAFLCWQRIKSEDITKFYCPCRVETGDITTPFVEVSDEELSTMNSDVPSVSLAPKVKSTLFDALTQWEINQIGLALEQRSEYMKDIYDDAHDDVPDNTELDNALQTLESDEQTYPWPLDISAEMLSNLATKIHNSESITIWPYEGT